MRFSLLRPHTGLLLLGAAIALLAACRDVTIESRGFSVEPLDVSVSAGCQPAVPPDPLDVSFDVQYRNHTSKDATWTLAHAGLKVAATTTEPEDDISFEVTPVDSGSIPAGEEVVVRYQKLIHTADKSACSFCGRHLSLELTWTSGSATQNATLDADKMACVQ